MNIYMNMSQSKVVKKENVVENNLMDMQFEFDFAMCHGSYFYCRS